MIRRARRFVLSLWLGMVVFTASGCVALLVGAAAGAGGVAYVKGSLEKDFDKSVAEVHRASVAGLKKIKMDIHADDLAQHEAHIKATDSGGKKVSIDINALTEHSAKIKIRVGIFGDQERSQMILNVIQKRL